MDIKRAMHPVALFSISRNGFYRLQSYYQAIQYRPEQSQDIMPNSKLLFLLVGALLGACTVTGPADDGYENSNEWVDNGRLLSDDKNGFTVYRSKKKRSGDAAASSDANSSSGDEQDYASYEKWLDAKENNTPEYQKFKRWQEFENFQRWQEQQETE